MATFMIVAKPIGKQPQKRLRVGLFITHSQSFGYSRYRTMAHREGNSPIVTAKYTGENDLKKLVEINRKHTGR